MKKYDGKNSWAVKPTFCDVCGREAIRPEKEKTVEVYHDGDFRKILIPKRRGEPLLFWEREGNSVLGLHKKCKGDWEEELGKLP